MVKGVKLQVFTKAYHLTLRYNNLSKRALQITNKRCSLLIIVDLLAIALRPGVRLQVRTEQRLTRSLHTSSNIIKTVVTESSYSHQHK